MRGDKSERTKKEESEKELGRENSLEESGTSSDTWEKRKKSKRKKRRERTILRSQLFSENHAFSGKRSSIALHAFLPDSLTPAKNLSCTRRAKTNGFHQVANTYRLCGEYVEPVGFVGSKNIQS